ncbi:MAG: 3-hydroxyacyl-CoA dehydrogenase [Candidatus Syntrophoarchaeum butanivorans]|uniref:3-hydroxyacyl-CoA dehydrogenase n=1 Tax=Candidatus Syntropharchaeum butanivorans TaxID=1839936 RepID=A0A1F2P786_9EURY|nr:MAG: 3-hydroxyacyl-CoA dehydrogenase [Candidatus Syntrophoarchaeum butanivorans]
MEIKKITVLGAGLMGNGIAQVCAQAGYEVIMRDIEDRFVENGMNTIKKNLQKAVEKGKMGEDEMNAVLGRITGLTDLKEAMKDPDLVIEAVPENMDLKKSIYSEIDALAPEKTIFASNTSSLSITEMASVTKRPEKFIGMHFFNPVPVMKLVELIRGFLTSDETLETVREVTEKLGKTPVVCTDSPGFIANRIALPMLNEAYYVLMEGIATREDIDTAMKLGYNHPMGPLELSDLVGLDTILSILDIYYKEFGDPKYRACPLLRKMVRAGLYGRKSGRGFYDYTK